MKLTERDLKLAGVKPLKEEYNREDSIRLLKELSRELHQAERYARKDAVDFAIIELEKKQSESPENNK